MDPWKYQKVKVKLEFFNLALKLKTIVSKFDKQFLAHTQVFRENMQVRVIFKLFVVFICQTQLMDKQVPNVWLLGGHFVSLSLREIDKSGEQQKQNEIVVGELETTSIHPSICPDVNAVTSKVTEALASILVSGCK